MALVKCRECGKQISNTATACPHCGAPGFGAPSGTQPASPARPPAKSNSGCLTLLVVLGALFVIGNVVNKVTEYQKDRAFVAQQKAQEKAAVVAAANLRTEFNKSRDEIFAKVEAAWAAKKPHDILSMLEPHKSYLDPTLKARYDAAWAATAAEREAAAERERKAAEIIAKADAARAAAEKATLDRIGKAPVPSAWDGSYNEVQRYLEKVANDPDSIDVGRCSDWVESEKGWVVRCEYRGKNAFGGLIKKNGLFVISHGKVVAASDL